MSFIETIRPANATGETLAMYQRQQGAWGYVPNYAKTFCYRPEVMARWGRLLAEIRRPVDDRRFELVTLAVAQELRHTPCSLAHGKKLADIIGADQVVAIARGEQAMALTETDLALMDFARKIARDASAITAEDVNTLKEDHGLSDEEVFDVVAVAAARCFFTKILDALGSEADSGFMKIDKELRNSLTVGKSITSAEPEFV